MTVSTTQATTGPMPGDGQNNLWPFAFPVTDASQVEVIRRAEAGTDLIVPATDYAVTLEEGGRRGGVVAYPLTGTRVPDTEIVVVRRRPAFTQERAFANQGAYDPHDTENALDELTFNDQFLLGEIERSIRLPASVAVDPTAPVPVADAFLKAVLLSSGSWRFSWTTVPPGAVAGGPQGELRVRYADDLELRGDGSFEVSEINAKLLALSEAGGGVVFLKAEAGYWPIDKELKVRSNVQLVWGSPQRLTRDGRISMVGNYAREPASVFVRLAATAGATVLAVEAGDDQPSSHLAVGDQVEIGDADRVRITAIDDDTLTVTIHKPTTRAYAVGAGIRRIVSSYLTHDIALSATPTEITVERPERFMRYDVVWLVDDESALDLGGAQDDLVNSELAVVVGFGGGGVLKLDRPVRHGFSTSNRARAVRIVPCRNASISGINIQFVEAPDADRIDTVQMAFCYQCKISDGAIYNEDDFGSRGQAFRVYRSLECDLSDLYVGPAKYRAAGEGYAFSIRESTGCRIKRCTGVGVRHVLSFSTATDCHASEIRGRLWTSNLIDFHGLREIGCLVEDVHGVGGGVAAQSGISFGNPTWPAGCFECKVADGLVSDLDGSNAKAIQIWPTSSGCEVEGVTFRRVHWGVYAEDIAGLPNASVGSLRIACRFEDVYECGRIDMRKNGAVDRLFAELDLSDSEFFQFRRGFYARGMVRFTAETVSMRTTVHESGQYAFELYDIGSPTIERGRFRGCRAVLRFGDCNPHLLFALVTDAGSNVVLQEASSEPHGGWMDAYGLYINMTPARNTTSPGIVLSLPGQS